MPFHYMITHRPISSHVIPLFSDDHIIMIVYVFVKF